MAKTKREKYHQPKGTCRFHGPISVDKVLTTLVMLLADQEGVSVEFVLKDNPNWKPQEGVNYVQADGG
mgnify:CR=1 FL=1